MAVPWLSNIALVATVFWPRCSAKKRDPNKLGTRNSDAICCYRYLRWIRFLQILPCTPCTSLHHCFLKPVLIFSCTKGWVHTRVDPLDSVHLICSTADQTHLLLALLLHLRGSLQIHISLFVESGIDQQQEGGGPE